MIDSLDTLILMGATDRVDRVIDFVSRIDWRSTNFSVIFFETTIRHLGGLLSSYALTKRPALLQQATRLGDVLFEALMRQPNRFPPRGVNLMTGETKNAPWTRQGSILADIGSVQMEWATLSAMTGDPKYFSAVSHIHRFLRENSQTTPGLYPIAVDAQGKPTSGLISVGSCADSFYEYQLKLFLLFGRRLSSVPTQELSMWNESSHAIIDRLYQEMALISDDQVQLIAFLGDLANGQSRMVDQRADHVSCFAGGLFALSASLFSRSAPRNDLERHLAALNETHLHVAQSLAAGCMHAYRSTKTGIGPESFAWTLPSTIQTPEEWAEFKATIKFHVLPSSPPPKSLRLGSLNSSWVTVRDSRYLLRPELIESLFYLWRTTKLPVYREWAWDIFESLQSNCRTENGGFSALRSVNAANVSKDNLQDSCESFFFAETLKYMYLIFSPDELLPLDRWVFNTEAHPLPVILSGELDHLI